MKQVFLMFYFFVAGAWFAMALQEVTPPCQKAAAPQFCAVVVSASVGFGWPLAWVSGKFLPRADGSTP